jgi:DNA invertase Pin-like site-specific DNA recombinase
MRAAIYARVSTNDKGQDVDLQLNELREFASKRGFEVVEYVDLGISGAKTKRPALDDLMKAARSRQIDVIVVWRMDRLGRSLSHLLNLLNEFQSLGVAFISLRESIDMTTPTGRLMAHMIGAFAEFEREIIRERVKAGIETARKKGKRIGRLATAPITKREIIRLHTEQNLSLRCIAKKTKTSLGTVQRTLAGYRAGTIDLDGFDADHLIKQVSS